MIASPSRKGFAEYLQGLVLRRRREGEIARVREHLSALHDRVDLVLDGLILIAIVRAGQSGVQRGGGLAALARMGLVDDDREAAIPVLRADIVEDEREFLDRRDDDLLSVGDETPEIAGVARHGRRSRPPVRTA